MVVSACQFLVGFLIPFVRPVFPPELLGGAVSFILIFSKKEQLRLLLKTKLHEEVQLHSIDQLRLVVDDFRFPSPDWSARLGCPAGTYAAGSMLPTECTPCQENITFTHPVRNPSMFPCFFSGWVKTPDS